MVIAMKQGLDTVQCTRRSTALLPVVVLLPSSLPFQASLVSFLNTLRGTAVLEDGTFIFIVSVVRRLASLRLHPNSVGHTRNISKLADLLPSTTTKKRRQNLSIGRLTEMSPNTEYHAKEV